MERAGSFKELKEKKNLILKTLDRCKSLGHKKRNSHAAHLPEARPYPQVGYVTVYIGPDKERFEIRTECLNHPLFKELLDEAKDLYGYTRAGPIELPCHVDCFDRVLWEIDASEPEELSSPQCGFPAKPLCGFGKGHASYRVLNPSRLVIGSGR